MIVNQKEQSKKIFAYAVLGAVTLMSLAFYLVQVNNCSTVGYLLKDLDARAKALTEENKKLEINIVKAQSIANLDEKVAALNMVPAENIKYLDGSSFAMAR
jgi:hypothetical protein